MAPDRDETTVRQMAEALGLTVLAGSACLDRPIHGALVSDLLSYVMASGRAGDVWITIQTHANTVAVAALASLAAIVVAAGFEPGDDTLSRAEEEEIPLLMSSQPAYVLAGRLFELGVR